MNRREQLSPNWARITKKKTGECYYINDITGEKIWYHYPKDKIRQDIEINGSISGGKYGGPTTTARPKFTTSGHNMYQQHQPQQRRHEGTNVGYHYNENQGYRYRDTDELHWHINDNGTINGPFSEDQMRGFYNNGRFKKAGIKVNNAVFENYGIWRSVEEYYPDDVYHPPFEGLLSSVVPVRKEFPWQYFTKESRYSTGGHWLCTRLLTGQSVMGREMKIADEETLLMEAKAARTIPHKNIVQFYESYIYEQQLVVFSEFMDGKGIDCLCSPTKHWTEDAISYVAGEVLKGLQAIHSLNRVHGSLTTSGIMYNSKGEVKISDVGMAYAENTPFAASPFFMSPEQVSNEKVLKTDIWALGVVLLHMANGRIPRSKKQADHSRVLKSIVNDPAPLLISTRWSDSFVEFINGVLRKEVDERLSTEQCLAHNFALIASLESFVQVVSSEETPEVQKDPVPEVKTKKRGMLRSLLCCLKSPALTKKPNPTLHSVNPFWAEGNKDLSREEL